MRLAGFMHFTPSLLPQGREFKLVWNDEFRGTQLDTSKWGYRTNFWEPDGYTCYIDGKQDGPKVGYATGDPVSHVPEFILITTEAKWYRNDLMTGKGVPELGAAAQANDAFVVDYVRVYDEVRGR